MGRGQNALKCLQNIPNLHPSEVSKTIHSPLQSSLCQASCTQFTYKAYKRIHTPIPVLMNHSPIYQSDVK